jgi:trehalose 6-phosphate synthase
LELDELDVNAITPTQLRRYLRDKYVIVVSNRGPVEFRRDEEGKMRTYRGAGGLVTAMGTALVATDAVWISPARSRGDEEMALSTPGGKIGLPRENPQYWVKFITPNREQFHLYYNIISNSLLWFLQHYMMDLTHEPVIDREIHRAWNEGYRKVNQLFADEVLREIRSTNKKPLVFLQDYHLYLCAHYIRKKAPDVLIHHFTHSPWIQPDYLRLLPSRMRKELMQGMLANDVLGFHTHRYAANFLQCCQEADVVRVSVNLKRRSVYYDGREILIRHYPISIDHEALERLAQREDVHLHRQKIRNLAKERRLIIRVDRIEPSKNILRGLKAYELFLGQFPRWREKVIFLLFLYPSREDLKAYRDYRRSIEETTRHINQAFGTLYWQPVYLDIEDNYPRSVAGLMEFDVLMVNPVFDGMNLISKEGALLNQRDGVILLSMNTGAYSELKGSVLPLNPLDIWETAQLIDRALSLPYKKRQSMARKARERVKENSSFTWLLRQIQNLRKVEKLREEASSLKSSLDLASWIRQI